MKIRIFSIIIFCCTQSLMSMEQEGRPKMIDLQKQTEQRISIGYAVLSLNFTQDPTHNERLIFSHYDKQNKKYAAPIDHISQYITYSLKQIPESSWLMVDPRYRDTHGEVACNLIRQDFEKIRNNNFSKEQWVIRFIYTIINREQEVPSEYYNSLMNLVACIKNNCFFKDVVSVCEKYHKNENKIPIPSLDELIDTREKEEIRKIEDSIECVLS